MTTRNREYVITQPDTPLPWINYLGSEEYFGIISNTAGGYSFYRDARLRRLTRYRYNNAPLDFGGRYIYLRDNVTGDYWSPSWQPTRRKLEDYTCRHGLGYSIIGSTYRRHQGRDAVFCAAGRNAGSLAVDADQSARGSRAAVSSFPASSFACGMRRTTPPISSATSARARWKWKTTVIYHKTEYRERRDHFAYFACSEPLAGFDTQREKFLGAYRGWHEPIVVEQGESTNSIAHGWQPIGSHHVKVTLQPGESRTIIFVLGYHENPRDQKFDPPESQTINKRTVKPIIAYYLNPANVAAAFDGAAASTGTTCWACCRSTTPDEHTNRMVNIWNAYQCMITFNMSRSASFYESGIGRGMGFRDSNQDLLGFVHMVPARARQRILDLAATQLPTGGAYHQYQPLTKRGNNDVGGNFNDDPAWLILGVAAYLKETGDWSILDELVPYDNKPELATPLYEHLQRSFQYTIDRLGPHGLPLIGRADWNDCLNLNCFSEEPGESFQTTTNREGTVAESVFIAGLFVLASHELADIADHLQHADEAQRYRAEADRMEETVKVHGWDGDWFLRAYDAFGNKVGSRECDEGHIFIESNGMCVMAGIGLQDGRAEQALAAVNEHLATPHGIVLQQPAYSRYYVHLGEISSYPPGYKENAGIFCHTNPWIMIAEALVGHGDQALRLLLAHQSVHARSHQRGASLRAVCVRADDRGQGCGHARRGEELVAHRHGGVELRGDYAVDSGHSAHAEWIARSRRSFQPIGPASVPSASIAA